MSYIKYSNDIVKLVDTVLEQAIEKAVSDVHLESMENGLRVRFRIDGLLYDQETIDHAIMAQVCSRVQVLANIDSSQQRIPHDGTFRMIRDGMPIDVRVSTFPALYGPKIVLRILDREQHHILLEQLGMNNEMLKDFVELIHKSSGFILVSGPTGSGKTTTLYAALSQLHTPHNHIITLEDPVEYHIPGITQGHIYPAVGFTFEKGIRALLRHDPDIVMVGEIRDTQTAHIALQAALTGHLVFSTIHTNDAPSVVLRLIDMDIEPFLINAALTGVLAQRLARKICHACKEQYDDKDAKKYMKQLMKEVSLPDKNTAMNIDSVQLYRGAGCEQCNSTGYKGRTGIFELLKISSSMRSLIKSHSHRDVLYEQALQDGMQPMIVDGLNKVTEGIISIEELIRVIT